jgi:hypothetical protein
MVAIVFASIAPLITWQNPTHVYLQLTSNCSTQTQSGLVATLGCQTSQPTLVANTWQVWNAYDGSGNNLGEYSSAVAGVDLPLTSLIPSTTNYLTISVPVQFLGNLPTGSDAGGSYFTCIFVSEQATITLNGNQVGTIQPLSTGGGPLPPSSFCSYSSAGTTITLQFAIVISGTAYPNLPYTNPPLDLRSKIRALNSANVNVGAELSQVWYVDKCYQQPRAAPGCTQEGNNVPIYTNYSISAGINVSSFTQGTISVPTQTASVTCLNCVQATYGAPPSVSYGQTPIISIAQTISSISSVEPCGTGCTATLQFNGTTVNTVVTITPVGGSTPSLSSLSNLLACGSSWYTYCVFGIPVWAWLVLIGLVLIAITLGTGKKRRGKRGHYRKHDRVTVTLTPGD